MLCNAVLENGMLDMKTNFNNFVRDDFNLQKAIMNQIWASKFNSIYNAGEFTVLNFRYILLIFSCLSY